MHARVVLEVGKVSCLERCPDFRGWPWFHCNSVTRCMRVCVYVCSVGARAGETEEAQFG